MSPKADNILCFHLDGTVIWMPTITEKPWDLPLREGNGDLTKHIGRLYGKIIKPPPVGSSPNLYHLINQLHIGTQRAVSFQQ